MVISLIVRIENKHLQKSHQENFYYNPSQLSIYQHNYSEAVSMVYSNSSEFLGSILSFGAFLNINFFPIRRFRFRNK